MNFLKFKKTASGPQGVNLADKHYNIAEAKLESVAEDFVKNGIAVYCDKDGKEVEVKNDPSTKAVSRMNLDELKVCAEENGVELGEATTKKQIAELLKEAGVE